MAKDKPTLDNIITDLRNSATPALRLFINLIPDYSFAQLRLIEDELYRRYKGQKIMPTTNWFFAFILGETIVRNVPGARWGNLDKDNPWEMIVTLKHKSEDTLRAEVRPTIRIQKYLDTGEDPLTAMYVSAEIMATKTTEEAMAEGNHIGDGWYKFTKNGEDYIMRMYMRQGTDTETPINMKDKVNILKDGKITSVNMESRFSPEETAKRAHKN